MSAAAAPATTGRTASIGIILVAGFFFSLTGVLVRVLEAANG